MSHHRAGSDRAGEFGLCDYQVDSAGTLRPRPVAEAGTALVTRTIVERYQGTGYAKTHILGGSRKLSSLRSYNDYYCMDERFRIRSAVSCRIVSLGNDHPSLYGLLDAARTPSDQQRRSPQISQLISPKMLSNRKEKRKKKD
jgi:hypothetical protein